MKQGPAVGAVDETGEQAHVTHFCRPSPLLAVLLNNIPCLLVNQGLAGILENHLFILWIEDNLFAFIGLLGGLEVYRMA